MLRVSCGRFKRFPNLNHLADDQHAGNALRRRGRSDILQSSGPRPFVRSSRRRRPAPRASRPPSRASAGARAITSRTAIPIITTSVMLFGLDGVERRVERLARVSGNHQEPGRQAAVRDRDTGQLRRGHGGRHTGHDLARDPGPRPAPALPRRRGRTRRGRRPSAARRACPSRAARIIRR